MKALSFILATAMFVAILLKSTFFAQTFGGSIPCLVFIVFYGMSILWIHGIGFEIRTLWWKALFLPLIGYLILIPSLFILIRL